MTSPFHTTWPALAGARPAIAFKSVVLPEPFGPMMPRISPASTPKDTRETAMSPLKRFVSAWTSSSTARPSHGPGDRPDDAARHDEDREDEDRAVEDRAQLGAEVDDVRQAGEHERADDRPRERALAAEQHHREDLHRLVDPEVAGIDVAGVVAVEPARERRERVADRERHELVAEHVHAERPREVFVEADGGEAAAHPRIERADAHEHGERERRERDVVPRDRAADRDEAGARPPDRGSAGH